MDLQSLTDLAKSVIREDEDHMPMFSWVTADGTPVYVAVPTYQPEMRDALINKLRDTLNAQHIVQYYATFSAWIVDVERAREEITKSINAEVKLKKISKAQGEVLVEGSVEFMKRIRPSQNKFREQVLLISQFHKTKGMNGVAYKYWMNEITGQMEFSDKPITLDGTMYSAWNVWTPDQIELNDIGDLI
jgi:hypothetical protein